MAKKDPNAGAKLLSADVKKVVGSIDLNPANVGYRGLREKVKAARTAKAAPKAGAKARGGKAMGASGNAAAPAAAKPAAAKAPAKSAASAPAAKAKATPTMTRGSMKRSAMPKAEMTVRDVVTENKISAPASSGIAKTKRDIKVGGLVGRTGGKWHLGKKAGKG